MVSAEEAIRLGTFQNASAAASHTFLVAAEEFLKPAIAAELPSRTPTWSMALSQLEKCIPVVRSRVACQTMRPELEGINANDMVSEERIAKVTTNLSVILSTALPEQIEKDADAIAKSFGVMFAALAGTMSLTTVGTVESALPLLYKLRDSHSTPSLQDMQKKMDAKTNLLCHAKEMIIWLDGKTVMTDGLLEFGPAPAASIAMLCRHRSNLKSCIHDFNNIAVFTQLHDFAEEAVQAQASRLCEVPKAEISRVLDTPYVESKDGSADPSLRSMLGGGEDRLWHEGELPKGKVSFDDLLHVAERTLFQMKAAPFAKGLVTLHNAIKEYEAKCEQFGVKKDDKFTEEAWKLYYKGFTTKLEALCIRTIVKNKTVPIKLRSALQAEQLASEGQWAGIEKHLKTHCERGLTLKKIE